MSNKALKKFDPVIQVEKLEEFHGSDLDDIADAMGKTIEDGLGFSLGFGWLKAPEHERLEKYWQGLLLVPEREIFVGRIDSTIASAVQLVKPSPTSQTQNFAGMLREHFVAPWARGHGLAKQLLQAAENQARIEGLKILKLEVRASQEAAIHLYEEQGYKKWGELDKYEMVEGQFVAGSFYYKDLI